MTGAPDEVFDSFACAIALLPSPPRAELSARPYPGEIFQPPDYNTLLIEKIGIADTDPNLRGSKRTGYCLDTSR